jgi:predicted PurR-regulated permease PerM
VAEKPTETTEDTSSLTSGIEELAAKFKRPTRPEVAVPDARKLDPRQQKQLIIAVVIALLAGFFLIRGFFGTIILSLLAAIIFHPIYAWLERKLKKPSMASTLTLLIALLIVIIPLIIAVLASISEIQKLITQLSHYTNNGFTSPSEIANNLLDDVNRLLYTVTNGSYQISTEQVGKALASASSTLASTFLNLLTASFSSIPTFITQLILFIYLFTSMLTNSKSLLKTLRDLNPLGDGVSSLYFSRTGEMTRGIVGGQFVIAICQGVSEAIVIYFIGIHYFYFFAILLSLMSVIPLGAGILTIPMSIIMVLTGNVPGGVILFLYHMLVVTNIDNILRPKLVPKSVRINSALMMLAVFGGIALFGFLGIAIGPIIMILILSTIQVYLPLARARNNSKHLKPEEA